MFDETADFKIEVREGNFAFSIKLIFLKDSSLAEKITVDVAGTDITLMCHNFSDVGTGLNEPANIGTFNGKEIFLLFWSYLEGAKEKKRVRSVKYTIFIEK